MNQGVHKLEENKFTCKNCGGELTFNPGSQSLKCPYCGTENENPDTIPEVHEELDFKEALAKFKNAEDTVAVQIEQCPACGAEVTLEANATTAKCDFCGTSIVAGGKSHKVMKPQYLLPFKITKDEAKKTFRQWILKRKFAPNDLKKQARMAEPLKGIYYPHWTFDADTRSKYSGKRGVHYTRTVEKTDSEGKKYTDTVTETRWTSVSGKVSRFFDDVLVAASRTLKKKLTGKLDEWNLKEMVSFSEKYLKGFKAESYSIDLEEGFSFAKEIMNEEIRSDIRHDIGGDEQEIKRVDTEYSDIKFKYILLPIWVVVYKFKDKYFQVLINGSNGEIEGERPFSVAKILLLVFGLLLLGGAGYLVYYLIHNGLI